MAADKKFASNLLICVIYKLRFFAYFGVVFFGVIYLGHHEFNYSGSDFLNLEYFNTSKEDITCSDVLQQKSELHSNHFGIPHCPPYPRSMLGHLDDRNIRNRSWFEIQRLNTDILLGGKFTPTKCIPRYKVAIIIPFRNRDYQLRTLLSHMHPIWKRQDISYQVYVITQIEGALFNRAKLLNIGVSEARKDGHYDCYVFHDVDILLEDDRCLYWCHELNPRHIAMHLDKFSYNQLTYVDHCYEDSGNNPIYQTLYQLVKSPGNTTYFGGISMLTGEQFDRVNGLSNLYWGWGGEDDDLYIRLKKKGYAVDNPYETKCSFRMLQHQHESQNAENYGRYSLLRYAAARMEKEGFTTLRYQIISRILNPLYTNITVNVGHPSQDMMNFMSSDSHQQGSGCFVKLPWIK